MKLFSFFTILLFTSFLGSCQSKNNNKNSTQLRDVENFTGIEVGSAIEVNIVQANNYKVEVKTNEDDMNKVITRVNSGVLEIKRENTKWSWGNHKVTVDIELPNIDNITVHGASTVKFNNIIKSSNLSVKVSGASTIKGEIKVLNLLTNISGASSLKLSGIAETVKIDCSGASSLGSYDFNCENAVLKASGASSIQLSVEKTLKATASGASSIRYKGNPNVIEANANGASSIHKKED